MSETLATPNESDAAATAAAEWPTDPSLYELVGKIGQGAFAIVWKATLTTSQSEGEQADQVTKHVCAVKVLNLDHVDTNLAEIRLEVQAMRLLSHPNVLTCYTAFVNERNLWLVTPLMTKGSSLHSLQSARRALRKQQREQAQAGAAAAASNTNATPASPPNMEQHILFIMHETLLGLQYIHENGQIHRDIKAGNILLDGNGDVKIADFGVSGFLVHSGSQQEKAKTFVGTPCWMAPEVMEQVHGYDYKADLWSLGITALELAKGYAPYARFPPMKVLILTIQEDPPSLATYDEETDDDDDDYMVNEEYSKQFGAFVDMCLQKNPARRPTCPELLASKYFAAFQDAGYRQERRDAIHREICSLVKDVGYKQEEAAAAAAAASSKNNPRLPGNAPISIVLNEAEDRPKGTTWVFADGSQVLSSEAAPTEVDDVMAELDAFGMQTGGEHYDRNSSNINTNATTLRASGNAPQPQQQQQQQHGQDDSHNAGDDLDQFMDEFEQFTSGEDFRRDHDPI